MYLEIYFKGWQLLALIIYSINYTTLEYSPSLQIKFPFSN